MARKPRFNLPGIPQHVIQRGNNRAPCFFSDEDRRFYLDHLREVAEEAGCAIHAYVLMTNHVHLLMTPQREHAVPEMMQALGRRYVRYVNRVHRRTGTLWAGRYKASLVDSDSYVLTCYRYIELNPVRAGMAPSAGDYRWSSHRATAWGEADGWITPHDAYLQLGTEAGSRQHAYRELFRHHMDENALHAVRDALNRELVLGSEHFKDRIGRLVARRVRPGRSGRPKASDAARRILGKIVL